MSKSLRCALSAILACSWAAGAAKVSCPKVAPEGAECDSGRDANGNFYFLAKPAHWNGVLLVFDHGGPQYNHPPTMEQLTEVAAAPSVSGRLSAGYAVAIPTYRDQYWFLDRYAEDNENTRKAFVARFGQPKRTYLEGQSFGAEVANRTIERFGKSYDAAVLVAGATAGAMLDAHLFFELRVVYQYYCHNLPKPDEPQYPLWRGWLFANEPGILPQVFDSHFIDTAFPTMLPRARECTAFDSPPEKRTAEQEAALRNILAVTHTASTDFRGRIGGSASFLYTLQRVMTGGRNVFGNREAVYKGSDDDRALNRGVERYSADAAAAKAFYELTTPKGTSGIPVISSHSIEDPRVPVEEESFYRHVVERAGNGARLLQVFTRRPTHPGTAGPEFLALMRALDAWTTSGTRPTQAQVAQWCEEAKHPGETCNFQTGYTPRPLSTLIPPEGRSAFLPAGW